MKQIKKTGLLIGMTLVILFFVIMLVSIPTVSAADRAVPGTYATIRNAINVSTTGDTVTVQDGYYVENIIVNKSIIIRSANGSATTWINGTVNVTHNDSVFGQEAAGFTVYQATITAGTHAIEIATNDSRNNITIEACTIKGGYDGIHIGQVGQTLEETTNITVYNCIIQNTGHSAIYAGPGQVMHGNFSSIRGHNVSNTARGAILEFDGGSDVLIYYCTLYNTETNGGEGINLTGVSNGVDNVRLDKNTIYNVGGYSPIIVRSTSAAAYIWNMRIIFNELENNSNIYPEAAVRFDNASGLINATNVTVMYNNINTTGNDIEEQFSTSYSNWTGVMKAYFNWYGVCTGGTFRYTTHLNADPYLVLGGASGNIWTGTDYLEITGASSGSVNATTQSDVTVGPITTTDDLVVVVYTYGLGEANNPLGTIYPVRAMHNYREVGVSNTSRITFPVNITVYYDAADLAIRGWSENRINGLMFYNETSAEWEEFNDTGKNTDYAGMSYSGYVWANAYTPAQLTGAVVCINFNEIVPEAGAAAEEEEEEAAAVAAPSVPWTFLGQGIVVWGIIVATATIVSTMALYLYATSSKTGGRGKKKK